MSSVLVDAIEAEIERRVRVAVEAEREACALIAEKAYDNTGLFSRQRTVIVYNVAANIRARGDKTNGAK